MFDRFNRVLKLICLGLAALLAAQISRLATRQDPLEQLSFTTLPILAAAPETQTGTKATNAVQIEDSTKKQTNSIPGPPSARREGASASRQPPGKAVDLPPAVQTRLERITQSEILGAVIRPLPMALLGIAGKDAFLRAPDGQTGLLREGEELGGVKLLRIGTNRVLIEHEHEQKELTVFSGFGSETLLPKGKANP